MSDLAPLEEFGQRGRGQIHGHRRRCPRPARGITQDSKRAVSRAAYWRRAQHGPLLIVRWRRQRSHERWTAASAAWRAPAAEADSRSEAIGDVSQRTIAASSKVNSTFSEIRL